MGATSIGGDTLLDGGSRKKVICDDVIEINPDLLSGQNEMSKYFTWEEVT